MILLVKSAHKTFFTHRNYKMYIENIILRHRYSHIELKLCKFIFVRMNKQQKPLVASFYYLIHLK